jgi:hypothetical protein
MTDVLIRGVPDDVAGALVAATAELAGLVVHDDKGFGLIAELTEQPTERLR